jgi:hypothetical protein
MAPHWDILVENNYITEEGLISKVRVKEAFDHSIEDCLTDLDRYVLFWAKFNLDISIYDYIK